MTDSVGWFSGVVLAIFFLDWLAVGLSYRRLECFLKPLAMILVIFWTLMVAGWALNFLVILLLFAQLAGLAGDIFLLLNPRWFLMGLSAFLMGHLTYIGIMGWHIYVAIQSSGLMDGWIWWLALIFVVWAAMLASFYRFIAPKTPRLTMPMILWVPIQVYGWILSGLVMMSLLVLITAPTLSTPVLFLLLGSLLFFVSDSLLAYDRFKRKMPKVRLWIMVTYHLAQFSLAAGFLALMGFING